MNYYVETKLNRKMRSTIYLSKEVAPIMIIKNDYNGHLASKRHDPKTNVKRYWSILQTSYDGKEDTNHHCE